MNLLKQNDLKIIKIYRFVQLKLHMLRLPFLGQNLLRSIMNKQRDKKFNNSNLNLHTKSINAVVLCQILNLFLKKSSNSNPILVNQYILL